MRIRVVYGKHNVICMPDIEIKEHRPGYVYVPLRGYKFTLAVINETKHCIGWIEIETLGFSKVKDWMKETNWQDQGY